VDSWLVDVLASLAPTVSKTILSVYDRIKDMKDDEAYRVVSLLLLAQVIEQNSNIQREIKRANEGITILLKRTEG